MTGGVNSTRALSISELLRVQAEGAPEAIAVAAPSRAPLTYRRLLTQVESTVKTLDEIGLGRNDRIAIVLPNGPEMAVAFLAVATCAVAAPLNPTYRASEFASSLSDLGARALLVRAGATCPAIAVAQGRGIPVIHLAPQAESEAGTFTLAGGRCPRTAHGGFATAEDVALVLSTSGTTSRPKIVPLTHANICSSAHNIRVALELSPTDRCLNFMPLFHIHGLIGALLASLAAGAGVFCTPGFSAPTFFAWLEEYHPTWYTAVPTMHQAILARVAMNRDTVARCPLRFVRSCSAPLPPGVMAKLEDVFHAPAIEAYGMTEAAHQIASNPLPPRRRKPGSVGLPTGVQVAIMDPTGRVLQPGQTGEIVICGASVTPGYENNVEANRDAWRGGWFRTGDLGYLDSEGYLFLSGRLKEIINRGGTKIAPREIDEVLLDHPAVDQAVTFPVPHRELGEDVAAAVVLREDASATERAIREFAAERLAGFKVPRRVLIVEEIPKGPSGKVQRIGLAEKLGLVVSGEGPGELKAGFAPPRTPLEKTLAEMWAGVLGLPEIGVHDDFFELGGDSILGGQLYSRVCQAMQVQVSLIRFFESPTIAGQALAIAESLPGAIPPSLVPIQPSGCKPPFFCIAASTDITCFLELARLLGPEQPFYAFQPGEMVRSQIPYTVENAAARYLRAMRSVQPEGPYFLGGACAGSAVALELGRQLMAQGQQVALLALIDPVLHGYFERTLHSYWLGLLRLPLKDKLRHVARTLRRLWANIRQAIHYRMLCITTKIHQSAGRSPASFSDDVQVTNRRALRKHARRAYPGRLTLFVTREPPPGLRPSLDPRVVWGELVTGGVHLVEISGEQHSFLGHPHVEAFAERLRACLDNAMTTAADKRACARTPS